MRFRTLAWIIAAYVAITVVTRLLEFDPNPWVLAVGVGLAASFGGLMAVTLRNEAAVWDVAGTSLSKQSGHDARFAATIRLVEGHLASREPDGILRDRLAGLADRTLSLRHGIGLDDPRARDLLGADSMALLTGPVRRLNLTEIEATLTRIEDL